MEPPSKKHKSIKFTLSYPADNICREAFNVEYLQGNVPQNAKKLLQDTKMFYLANKSIDTQLDQDHEDKHQSVDYGPHFMRTLWADYVKPKEVKVVRTWPERDQRTKRVIYYEGAIFQLRREFPASNLLSVLTSAEMVYVALKRNP